MVGVSLGVFSLRAGDLPCNPLNLTWVMPAEGSGAIPGSVPVVRGWAFYAALSLWGKRLFDGGRRGGWPGSGRHRRPILRPSLGGSAQSRGARQRMIKRILTVAGSDSGGGAGIHADLKTIAMLGGYGMSAVTALTAQNSLGIQGVFPVPAEFVVRQIESVLSDIGADAVKTGMLVSAKTVLMVAEQMRRFRIQCLVVDPVMAAESGRPLLDDGGRSAMIEALFPLALAVTPNLVEASTLCGFPVRDLPAMKEAARAIHALGPRWVVVKGGHLDGDPLDLLFDGDRFQIFRGVRLANPNTHGTGCTFSTALATLLTQGLSMTRAVKGAKAFTTAAIAGGLGLGAGHGPVNPCAHRGQLPRQDED